MENIPSKDSVNEFRQTAGNAGIIGITAFLGAIVGFGLQLIVAYFFGAGQETDAYFMALSTSEMLSKLLLGGSITAVFLPIFVERLARGEQQSAWHLALNLIHLSAAAFILLTVILAIFADPFVRFIAPGFDPATTSLTVSLLRILLPSFIALFLVELTTSMLHALREFRIPATMRLVAPLTSIVIVASLASSIGIYALAIGTITGAVLQLAILFTTLHRRGMKYGFIFQPTHPAIKNLIKLVYPFIFSVLVTQVAGIVYRILVSELTTGSLSALKYAEKITQLLTIIFLNSVTLVIFPLLSEKASHQDYAGMRSTISSAIRLIAFVTIPVIIGVTTLREPLIQLLFERGSFTAEDSAMTSIALLFLVIGLTTNGIGSVFGHATLALKATRVSVAVSIASQVVAITLFYLLVPRLAHAGLALASSLVPLSIASLYFLYLRRLIPKLGTIFLHATYLKTFLLAALLFCTLSLSLRGVSLLDLPYNLATLLQLIIPTILGSLVFFGGAYLWNIEEIHETMAIAQGKMGKWKRALHKS